jgi:radical SAM superfamily enzyme YgiQ (UPF0313 family)
MDMLYTKKDIEVFLDELFPRRSIKKVLLVNPPDSHSELFRYNTAKRGRYSSYPPYGLAVLAQNLRDIGVEVEICNLNYEILKECYESEDSENFDFDEIWQSLLDLDIASFQPDFIGITCMFTMSHESLKRICAWVSSKKIPFGVGGVHMSYDQAYVLDDIPTIPIAFLREGDLVIKNFIGVVNRTVDADRLGQMILNSGKARISLDNECVPSEEEINVIPAWDLVDARNMSKYGVTGSFKFLTPPGTRISTILSNRGCRADCSFCGVRAFNGRGVRQRSITSVVDELESLKDTYGIGHFIWLDDDLFKDEKRAIGLFNEMTRRNLNMTWDASNGVIAISCTEAVISAAEESGCIALNIGMESGSPEILKIVRKPGTLKNFVKAAEVLHNHENIHACLQLMVGFPGETMSMVMDTVRAALEMDMDWCRISPLQPLPGTPIYLSMIEQGLIKDDSDRQETRYAGGPFGKQAEIEQGLRQATLNFEEAFADIPLDSVPSHEQITDIWFYMNYHLNFHRIFREDRPLKIKQLTAILEHLSDVIAPENGFALYFLGFLQYKSHGKINTSVVERLSKKLEDSEYWRDRFSAFGLSLDDMKTLEFSNRYVPRLLPKGYKESLVA